MSGLVVPVAGVRAILDGTKTTHRVPARGVDRRYHPGRTYALQALRAREVALRAGGTTRRRQAGPAVARVRITAVELQALEDMTDADARAEGFPGLETFLDAWQERYGDPPARVAREECWVLSLEVLTEPMLERPRFLSRTGFPPYTRLEGLGMVDERPHAAVDPETQDKITMLGTQEHLARIAEADAARERLELRARLDAALADARAAGVDTTRQEEAILQRIRALESKVRRRAA